MIWQQTWSVMKHHILHLFQTLLNKKELSSQWWNTKIIPLKKLKKRNYTKAKVWHLISLLPILNKALKTVVTKRLSYVVEAHALLPINHFKVRKQWFTEQVLMLLQERIYRAWHQRKVLSLISFNVKDVYNRVYKKRLLQRLCVRCIPSSLCWWVNAFCFNQTTTLSVNEYDSKKQRLSQAGLSQRSLLFFILFLFFNTDLVKKKIDSNREALMFVDDYTT